MNSLGFDCSGGRGEIRFLVTILCDGRCLSLGNLWVSNHSARVGTTSGFGWGLVSAEARVVHFLWVRLTCDELNGSNE